MYIVVSFQGESPEDFVAKLAAFSSDTEALTLGENELGERGIEELKAMVRALPKNLLTLNLHGNSLGAMKDTDLVALNLGVLMKTLRERCPNLNELSLEGNDLGDTTRERLLPMTEALPPSLLTLELGFNMLGALLPEMIRVLPRNLKKLGVERNNLGSRIDAELFTLLQGLREQCPNLQMLNLGSNDLGIKTGAEISAMMRVLSDNLLILNLTRNDLHRKTGDELADIMSSLPRKLEMLLLAGNHFNEKTLPELQGMMEALRERCPELQTLSLSDNCLGKKTDTEISAMMRVLPENLRELNLTGNALADRSGVELVAMMVSLRERCKDIVALKLANNGLGNKTCTELLALMEVLPLNLQTLHLGSNKLDQKTGAELESLMRALPENLLELYLGYNGLGTKSGTELIRMVNALQERCPSLQTLDLGIDLFAGDPDPKAGAELVFLMGVLPNNLLNLTLNSREFNIGSRTDFAAMIKALRERCQNLQTLNVNLQPLVGAHSTDEELIDILNIFRDWDSLIELELNQEFRSRPRVIAAYDEIIGKNVHNARKKNGTLLTTLLQGTCLQEPVYLGVRRAEYASSASGFFPAVSPKTSESADLADTHTPHPGE